MERVGLRGEQPVAITRYGGFLRRGKVRERGSRTSSGKWAGLGRWAAEGCWAVVRKRDGVGWPAC